MKKNFGLMFLGIMLCSLALCFAGCEYGAQTGETAAEGGRRHQRNLRVNQQLLMEDVDKVLLFDKPSKLTDKKIP